MNCCDTWGNCTQGRDCPVRTGKVLPHQADHAAHVAASSCAPEGGNVWFAEPEPPELAPWEAAGVYLLVGFFAALSFAILAGLTGYIVGRWLA